MKPVHFFLLPRTATPWTVTPPACACMSVPAAGGGQQHTKSVDAQQLHTQQCLLIEICTVLLLTGRPGRHTGRCASCPHALWVDAGPLPLHSHFSGSQGSLGCLASWCICSHEQQQSVGHQAVMVGHRH